MTNGLNLTTNASGAPIRIDGQQFEIKHPENLSLWEYRELMPKADRLAHLMAKPLSSDGQKAEASRLLTEVVDVVLDAPADVRARLRDSHRVQIVFVFSELRGPQTKKPAPARVDRRSRAAKGRR